MTVSLHAQPAGRYITEAIFRISTGDWAQIWLNGHKFMDQDPNISSKKGYDSHDFERDELCYFQKENILNFVITQTLINPAVEGDHVAMAYYLEITFSDKSKQVFSSNEVDQHLMFYAESKTPPDPEGWEQLNYNDSSWKIAEKCDPQLSIVTILSDPKNHKPLQYLSVFEAKNLGYNVGSEMAGSRRFFRRKILLDIVPAPPCPQPIPTATPNPRPTATATWTFTPLPRPTATPTFTSTPRPTLTPTPAPVVRKLIPTPTVAIRRVRRLPTFTPTSIPFIPTDTPAPIRRLKPKPTPTFRIIPTATFTQAALPVES